MTARDLSQNFTSSSVTTTSRQTYTDSLLRSSCTSSNQWCVFPSDCHTSVWCEPMCYEARDTTMGQGKIEVVHSSGKRWDSAHKVIIEIFSFTENLLDAFSATIREFHHFNGSSILARGWIMLNCWTPMHIFSTVTTQHYRDNILKPYICSIVLRIRQSPVGIMNVNARLHRVELTDG